ncbi:YugN family protein [Bacillus sp. FSL L8-0199]|uniref:YugN family protein n=1 Tax=Bacillus TaxID=1386 RepID=UPI000A7831C8|nr:YugN family protein [Bacillus cereus]
MIPIQSNLEGRTYALYKLEEIMKPLGYSIGGNWDYDKGCFDYKIDEEDGYQFLRVPFTAIDGELDDNVNTLTAGTSGMDQFAEPKDPDGDVKRKYINIGKVLMQELERHFTNGE